MDPVVMALRAALQVGDSVEVRVALAEHLLKAGDSETALAEIEAGLRLAPANGKALELAVQVCEARNDLPRANAYRLALQSSKQTENQSPKFESPRPDSEQSLEPSLRLTSSLRLVSRDGQALEDRAEQVITFADVAGMSLVKERLERSFLSPLKNPEVYAKFNKKIGGGLLLYGPPGCGKTHIARAAAGEIGARFMSIGISEVLDMWMGESEKKLHERFEMARRRAPTVMFFDELDALGQRRTAIRGSALRTVLNQLLAELDGFGSGNGRVFFLAATNHPWDIDPALRRPGRFDRMLFVAPPELEARKVLVSLKLRDRPVAKDLDVDKWARAMDGFSGADVAAAVDFATELAIERTLQSGQDVPVSNELFSLSLRETKSSTRPWFETARNYALYSNEGGVYDDLLPYLKTLGLS